MSWPLSIGKIAGRAALDSSTALSPFALDYVTAIQDTGSNTTYTFTAQSLGAVVIGADKRYTIVTAGCPSGSSQVVNGITVGGLSATKVVNFGTAQAAAEIWIVETTSLGATADIAVTWSAGAPGCGIGVYRMVNPSSSTASATATANGVAGVCTATLTIATGGKAIAVTQSANTVLCTNTWTGTALPTENYDAEVDAGDGMSGAISTVDGASLTFIATATRTDSSAQHAVAAAWI